MVTVHPEYVLDEQQSRQEVVLPLAEWEQVLSELEELDDIRIYDAAKEQPPPRQCRLSRRFVKFKKVARGELHGRDSSGCPEVT